MSLGTVVQAFDSFAITASPLAFASASIELYGRLWHELERLADQFTASDGRPTPRINEGVVTFRLQLVVLVDACNSTRWKSLLGADERLELRSTLEDALGTLAVPTDSLEPSVLALAQDQLFEAVLGLHAAVSGRQSPVVKCG